MHKGLLIVKLQELSIPGQQLIGFLIDLVFFCFRVLGAPDIAINKYSNYM